MEQQTTCEHMSLYKQIAFTLVKWKLLKQGVGTWNGLPFICEESP